MNRRLLYPLIPGERVEDDWFDGIVPPNVVAGDDCLVDSAHTFQFFHCTDPGAIRLGDRVTLWTSRISSVDSGHVEIGDDTHLQGVAIAVSSSVHIGSRCALGSNVTIFDSDFHPVDYAARRRDTYATRPVGDRIREPLPAQPVWIGDDVWVSPGATISKGVSVGDGAQILPGAVVLSDVPPGVVVGGNPAREI